MSQKNIRDKYNIAYVKGSETEISALFENSEFFSKKNYKNVQKKVDKIIENLQKNQNVNTEISMRELMEDFKYKGVSQKCMDVNAYFDYLDEHVVRHSNHTFSPKYIGHMTSALPYFIGPLSKLITSMNQNTVKCETSKSVTPLERQTIAWVHKMLYRYSDTYYEQYTQDRSSTLGMLTSGGTTANLTALWCARNKCFGPDGSFPGIDEAGLLEAFKHYKKESAVIIGSVNMHYSITKAADLLGIGIRNVIKVEVDSDNRMDINALKKAVMECRKKKKQIVAIIGIAGVTDNGAIDPLEEIARVARTEKCHFHVDAAWGGPLIFSDKYSYKLKGMELADSITIDGHKQFYLPIGIGMLYFKERTLTESIEKIAAYIIREKSRDLGRYSLEGSKAALCIYLHAALNIIGKKGYAQLIDEGIDKTKYFACLIKESTEFELLNEPETNIILYHYVPEEFRLKDRELFPQDIKKMNDLNICLQRTQREHGKSFVSRSMYAAGKYAVNGRVALRAVIANPLTTKEDLKEILEEQKKIAFKLAGQAFGKKDQE